VLNFARPASCSSRWWPIRDVRTCRRPASAAPLPSAHRHPDRRRYRRHTGPVVRADADQCWSVHRPNNPCSLVRSDQDVGKSDYDGVDVFRGNDNVWRGDQSVETDQHADSAGSDDQLRRVDGGNRGPNHHHDEGDH